MSVTEVIMPSMGEGVNEANLTKWLVKEGDLVEKDAPILEVSTDKVDTEITASVKGYIRQLRAKEGETVTVDQVLALITEDEHTPVDEGTAPAPSVKKPEGANTNASTAETSSPSQSAPMSPARFEKVAASGPVKSSPLVRKMAKELGIDLLNVTGSGLNGRITKKDIVAYDSSYVAPSQPQSSRHNLPELSNRTLTKLGIDGLEYMDGVPVERKPMSRMRQLIADHMVESVRVSPHVTTVFEIDMKRIWDIRESEKRKFEKAEGFKLTFTPFLIHAAVQAIKEHPIVNTSLDGTDILFKKHINMGCAVAIDDGLIVPVIKNAGELNLLGIARRLNDLVQRARTKKLKPEDVQGGTFSVTNPGGFGSITSNPIINQPQVAILGIGAIVKRAAVVDDMIAIRPQMMASLTFDHRVIDGEGGAKWLATFKSILESYSNPF